jgi:hypothetical protein
VLGTPSSQSGALSAYRHGWEMIAGVSLLAALSGIVLLRNPRRVVAEPVTAPDRVGVAGPA